MYSYLLARNFFLVLAVAFKTEPISTFTNGLLVIFFFPRNHMKIFAIGTPSGAVHKKIVKIAKTYNCLEFG
jgi:hypothetical protein